MGAISGHGGNVKTLASRAGRTPGEILDFSANINPLGPPEWLRDAVSRALEDVAHYPDPEARDLIEAIAEHEGVGPEEIVVGNGSTEILRALPGALGVSRGLIPVPSYTDYAAGAELAGLDVELLRMRESDGFALDVGELRAGLRGRELVYLGNPNNPTGLLLDAEALREIVLDHPSSIFLIDEAFADFVEGYKGTCLPARQVGARPANAILLKSMTKFYAIPGLRLGYAIAAGPVAGSVRRTIPPWSVNTLAQAVGARALADEPYAARTRACVGRLRKDLAEALAGIEGLAVYPGTANFLLVRLSRSGIDARGLAERLLAGHGVAIRVCDDYAGLDGRFFRVAVRTAEENSRLLAALGDALGRQAAAPPGKSRRAAIMIQGTGSNVGKSVLVAALCRILVQDGLRAAPFKAQNMSLNSFVTREGLEIGRAQAMQAQACRIEPDARMNPVLLKPVGETGSQVVVLGKPVGNMSVAEYIRYKERACAVAMEAFDSLAGEYDALVLEGAGSPAEVNLKRHDIVNMRMAEHAGCPVLLVGDIDRGGVFAALVGTMELLSERERSLVAGFIVNRFRGDESLLADALSYMLRRTGRPVLGVVPFIESLGLPQEDSVDFKGGSWGSPAALRSDEAVDIALIDLPHISNFTDFDALLLEPDVRLRVVRRARELMRPDAIVIPGSKNVIADLEHVKATGLAEAVKSAAAGGSCEIVGICGGFQMMGGEIRDPAGVESSGGAISEGLGLLAVRTILAEEKILKRIEAVHEPSGLPVTGYEIHHGRTELDASARPAVRARDGSVLGAAGPGGLVWGTYLHGIFDSDIFRRRFIDGLRTRRGLAPIGKICARYGLEEAFDSLAAVVRRSVKMDAVYKLMGI